MSTRNASPSGISQAELEVAADKFAAYEDLPVAARNFDDSSYDALAGNFVDVIIGGSLSNTPVSIIVTDIHKLFLIAKVDPGGAVTNELTIANLSTGGTGKFIRQAAAAEDITTVEWTELLSRGGSAYAYFFDEDSSLTTTINSAGVFEDINVSLTGDKLNNFTVSGNTITYTGPFAIDVEIDWTVVASDAGDNKDRILMKAHKNGTVALNARGRSMVAPNGGLNDNEMTLSVFHTTSLVQNDTIDLMVANDENGSNINVFEISGVIRQI